MGNLGSNAGFLKCSVAVLCPHFPDLGHGSRLHVVKLSAFLPLGVSGCGQDVGMGIFKFFIGSGFPGLWRWAVYGYISGKAETFSQRLGETLSQFYALLVGQLDG